MPEAPKDLEDLRGGEVPLGAGEELKEVYKQDLVPERDLRRQNIIQLTDGSYLQARPDGERARGLIMYELMVPFI